MPTSCRDHLLTQSLLITPKSNGGTRELADRASKPFRDYYLGGLELRETFVAHLSESGQFHIFLSSAEAVEEELEEELEEEVEEVSLN